MEKNRSHQFNFVFDVMPALFHSQTDGFQKFIDKDGVKFLKFYWDHLGDQLPEEKRTSSAGLTVEIDQLNKKTRLITITLPSPKEDGEVYFVGCIPRPERRFAFVRFYTSTMYVLCRSDKVNHAHRTSFGEVTPRGNYRETGVGLNPTKADFKRIIKNKLERKK
jgi:hypothetical protein